jgi:hypothetical protein
MYCSKPNWVILMRNLNQDSRNRHWLPPSAEFTRTTEHNKFSGSLKGSSKNHSVWQCQMPKELGDGLVCFIVGDTAVATALHVSDLFGDSPTLISESGGSPSAPEQQSNQLACCVAAKCSVFLMLFSRCCTITTVHMSVALKRSLQ